MNKLVVAAAVAAFASAANAQVPLPSTGDGGLLFAAWDDNQSYTFNLGETFGSFDVNTAQQFTLTDFDGFFAGDFSWNIIGADASQVPGEGVDTIGVLATGTINNVNDFTMNSIVGALDRFAADVNNACGMDAVCTATAADVHYANRAGAFPYGDNLFPGQFLTSAGPDDEVDFFFAEQNGLGFFAIDPVLQPFTWTLSSDGTLTYGDVAVVPVPAAFWLLLSGIAGIAGIRRSRA